MNVRVATADDAEGVTRTLSHAFHDDPTWSWAFPDPERRQAQYAVWWGLLVAGALRYPWVLTTPGYEAAAVWLPPDGTELAPEDERRVRSIVEELVGDHAAGVLELLERFDEARPTDRPNYYLSLLGVDDPHRGSGLGMGLLRESIGRFDAEGVATYLESSNAANNPKYERLGYEPLGEFTTPDGAVVITRYWRDAAR